MITNGNLPLSLNHGLKEITHGIMLSLITQMKSNGTSKRSLILVVNSMLQIMDKLSTPVMAHHTTPSTIKDSINSLKAELDTTISKNKHLRFLHTLKETMLGPNQNLINLMKFNGLMNLLMHIQEVTITTMEFIHKQ